MIEYQSQQPACHECFGREAMRVIPDALVGKRPRAEKRRIWLSGNRRQPFADGFGVLAKLFRVAIDLPRRSADVSAKASFRTF
jgi:hypothetical protein